MQIVDWIVKQTGKISDNFNQYKFFITHQPEIIDSSSILSINTYVSRDKTATVPCSFRWFTIRNGVTTQVVQFRGNTYICEPNDVGAFLQAQITSSDTDYGGTAVVRYGPVKFDVLLKKQIQMALSSGQTNFFIDITQNKVMKECQLRVSQQRITLNHLSSQTYYSFSYNMIQPRMQVLHKVPTKVQIVFNPKYYDELRKFLVTLLGQDTLTQQLSRNPFLEVDFSNRKAKDSFVFITKAFNTKKQLKASTYVVNLQRQLDFSSSSFEQKNRKNYDYIQQISQLQSDVSKLLEINSKQYLQKRMYLEENKRLQKEIQDVVGIYVKIIQEKFSGREDFQKSFVVLKEKQEDIKAHRVQQKLARETQDMIHQLYLQNQQLKQTIKNMNSQTHQTPNFTHANSTPQSFKKKPSSSTQQVIIYNTQRRNQLQEMLRINQQTKRQKQQIELKYQRLRLDYDQLEKRAFRSQNYGNNNSIMNGNTKSIENNNNVMNSNTKSLDCNLDGFDARSVHSLVRHTNLMGLNNITQHNYSLLISKDSIPMEKLRFNSTQLRKPLSPELDHCTVISFLQQQNNQLKSQNSTLQQQVLSLQQQVLPLQQQAFLATQQSRQKQQKYKKKINELSQQIQIYKRNSDVLNRSQHLSMQMDQYNQEQQNTLKNQNQFLLSENQRLNQLSRKYMADAKKYKLIQKQAELTGSILQHPITR